MTQGPDDGEQPTYGNAPPPSSGYGEVGGAVQGGGAYGGGPAGAPPQNYLVWAILTTIFCCLPFGIASIVFAARVNSLWAQGDQAGAEQASRQAKKWAKVSAIVGVVVGVVVGILYVAVFAALIKHGSTTTTTTVG